MNSDDKVTKVTLETLLERVNAVGIRLDTKIDDVNRRLDGMDGRLDRIEGSVNMLHTKFDIVNEEILN